LFLLVVFEAHAFYSPSTGRWLNRDPILENGFQRTSLASPQDSPKLHDDQNDYCFVDNDSSDQPDRLGLTSVHKVKSVT
jgi:hypothetical protein